MPTLAFCQPQQGAPGEWQHLLPGDAEQGSWTPRSSLVLTARPTGSSGQVSIPPGVKSQCTPVLGDSPLLLLLTVRVR